MLPSERRRLEADVLGAISRDWSRPAAIAKAIGSTDDRVRNALAQMRKAGRVERRTEKTGGGSNNGIRYVYRLTIKKG